MQKCIDCKKELASSVAIQTKEPGIWETERVPYNDIDLFVMQGRCKECTHEHVRVGDDILPTSYKASDLYRVMYAQDSNNIVTTRMRQYIVGMASVEALTPSLKTHEIALDELKRHKAKLDRYDRAGAIYLLPTITAETRDSLSVGTVSNGTVNISRTMFLARLVNSTPHKTGLYKGYNTVYWQRTIALASHASAASGISWLNGSSSWEWGQMEVLT